MEFLTKFIVDSVLTLTLLPYTPPPPMISDISAQLRYTQVEFAAIGTKEYK